MSSITYSDGPSVEREIDGDEKNIAADVVKLADTESEFVVAHPLVALLFVSLIALTPLITMFIFISGLHSVFSAMLVMHLVCMLTLPLLYVRYTVNFHYFSSSIRRQLSRWEGQLPVALVGCVICAFSVVFGYLLVRCGGYLGFCPQIRDHAIREGMDLPLSKLICFGVYFCIINPIIEELFWRLFVYKEFGSAWVSLVGSKHQPPPDGSVSLQRYPLPSRSTVLPPGSTPGPSSYSAAGSIGGDAHPAATRDDDTAASTCCSSRAACWLRFTQLFKEEPNWILVQPSGDIEGETFYVFEPPMPGIPAWLAAAVYASYHVVVVSRLMNTIYGCLSFFFLTLLGRYFSVCCNNKRLGLLSAVFFHAGVDVGVTISLANTLLRWF
eukprot:GHVU01032876.1.p1 GENE.GHVU01032876.1~~GHVU01032876.1.p1  ORF type:complete len:383 (-),score=29.32 GHVU01032876.1:268-1416(-)